jgi:hypothetical protein
MQYCRHFQIFFFYFAFSYFFLCTFVAGNQRLNSVYHAKINNDDGIQKIFLHARLYSGHQF